MLLQHVLRQVLLITCRTRPCLTHCGEEEERGQSGVLNALMETLCNPPVGVWPLDRLTPKLTKDTRLALESKYN